MHKCGTSRDVWCHSVRVARPARERPRFNARDRQTGRQSLHNDGNPARIPMSTAPTDLDFVAAILVLIILVVSALTLFGMGILMAVGAVFSKRPLVTSWPSDQEHSFAAFEHRGTMSSSQAWVLSLLGAVGLTIFATGVYFGVAPDRK